MEPYIQFLKSLFGQGDYNKYIPKFDGMIGAMISISFSLFGYVYVFNLSSISLPISKFN